MTPLGRIRLLVVAVYILMKWSSTIFIILAYSNGVLIEKNYPCNVVAFLAHDAGYALSLYNSPLLVYPCYHATELHAIGGYGPSKNIVSFTGLR